MFDRGGFVQKLLAHNLQFLKMFISLSPRSEQVPGSLYVSASSFSAFGTMKSNSSICISSSMDTEELMEKNLVFLAYLSPFDLSATSPKILLGGHALNFYPHGML